MEPKIRKTRRHKSIGVLAIGDVIDDIYIFGRFTRPSPEDPNLKIFQIRSKQHYPGGMLFMATAFRSLFRNHLVYVQSMFTPATRQLLPRYHLFPEKQRSTTIFENQSCQKIRTVDDDTLEIISRMDFKTSYMKHRVAQYKTHLKAKIKKRYTAVLISDYQKGSVDADLVDYVAGYNVPVFVDTKNPDLSIWSKLPNVYVKCNANEFEKAYNKESVKHLIVTAGEQGAYYYHNGHCEHFPAFKFNGKPNVIGAGDVFLAAFAGKMLETQMDVHESIRYANIAARTSLRRFPTHMITQDNVRSEIKQILKGQIA